MKRKHIERRFALPGIEIFYEVIVTESYWHKIKQISVTEQHSGTDLRIYGNLIYDEFGFALQ